MRLGMRLFMWDILIRKDHVHFNSFKWIKHLRACFLIIIRVARYDG